MRLKVQEGVHKGKAYNTTLPGLPDEIIAKIEGMNYLKSSLYHQLFHEGHYGKPKTTTKSKLKEALYSKGPTLVKPEGSRRKTSLVRRKLAKLKL